MNILNIFLQELKLCGFNLDKSDNLNKSIRLFNLMYYTYTGRVTGVDSIIGSMGAQEVIKAVTHKYEPINQILYMDGLDILPDSYLETRKMNISDFEDKNDRYDGQRRIFGNNMLNAIVV